jgi:uncharacterized protein (DUF1330 family)
MPAYLIADLTVTDPDAFRKYQEAVPAIIAAHGGRYLVRGGASRVLEGHWEPGRLVVLEFPDPERAEAFWTSEDYARIADWRQQASLSNIVLVEGVTPPS